MYILYVELKQSSSRGSRDELIISRKDSIYGYWSYAESESVSISKTFNSFDAWIETEAAPESLSNSVFLIESAGPHLAGITREAWQGSPRDRG